MEAMKEIKYSTANDWAWYALITAAWTTLKLSGVWADLPWWLVFSVVIAAAVANAFLLLFRVKYGWSVKVTKSASLGRDQTQSRSGS